MVFFGIMLLHITAILLFTRGFLLTRTELSQYSQCSDVSESPCLSPEYQNPELNEEEDDSDDEHCCRHPHHRNQNQTVNPDIEAQSCWTKPAVDRIVIIILDALRFDFVAPSSFFQGKCLFLLIFVFL